MGKVQKLGTYGLLIGTLAGIGLGLVSGFGLRYAHPSSEMIEVIAFPGVLFLRSLQLMVLPSVLFSLIAGAASLNIQSSGKIALRTFGYFLATSLFNTFLGVGLTILIHPGDPSLKGQVIAGARKYSGRPNTLLDNILDLCRNIIPNNVFTTLFELTQTVYSPDPSDPSGTKLVKSTEFRHSPNFLGVITLALIIGTALSTMGNDAKPLLDLVKTCEKVFSKIMQIIFWVMPIGLFSIICSTVLEQDNLKSLVAQLGLFVLTIILGVFIYQLIFMQLFYFLIIRKNPYTFYVGLLPAALTGFALQSSGPALPVTLQCLDENAKIDPRISHFVVPLGTTINMNGTAFFVTAASIFIAQMNAVSLGIGGYITICITATAVSIAASTVPSASLSIMFIILNSVGVPAQDIGLLFSVDWLLDRFRTTNNLLGDCYTAAIVEHLSQKELALIDAEHAAAEIANDEEKANGVGINSAPFAPVHNESRL